MRTRFDHGSASVRKFIGGRRRSEIASISNLRHIWNKSKSNLGCAKCNVFCFKKWIIPVFHHFKIENRSILNSFFRLKSAEESCITSCLS
jgi:hypothetical protein